MRTVKKVGAHCVILDDATEKSVEGAKLDLFGDWRWYLCWDDERCEVPEKMVPNILDQGVAYSKTYEGALEKLRRQGLQDQRVAEAFFAAFAAEETNRSWENMWVTAHNQGRTYRVRHESYHMDRDGDHTYWDTQALDVPDIGTIYNGERGHRITRL